MPKGFAALRLAVLEALAVSVPDAAPVGGVVGGKNGLKYGKSGMGLAVLPVPVPPLCVAPAAAEEGSPGAGKPAISPPPRIAEDICNIIRSVSGFDLVTNIVLSVSCGIRHVYTARVTHIMLRTASLWKSCRI